MSILRTVLQLNHQWDHLLSSLMIAFLRLNGAQIGKGCFISISSRVASSKVIIGNDTVIKRNTRIKTRSLSIGSGCIISEDCYITGSHSFSMGDLSFVGKRVRINTGRDVTIGRDVGLGEGSTIWTHGYFPPADEGYPIVYKPVTIDDGAWVSTNIIVLPGVTIGKRVIVGAGSVVTKPAADGQLIAGNPAKAIKNVDEFRNKRPFLEVMSAILQEFNGVSNSEPQAAGCLLMKCRDRNIWIYDGKEGPTAHHQNDDIIFFKHFASIQSQPQKATHWFNFDTRIRNRAKDNLVNEIAQHLRGYGIRFVIEG